MFWFSLINKRNVIDQPIWSYTSMAWNFQTYNKVLIHPCKLCHDKIWLFSDVSENGLSSREREVRDRFSTNSTEESQRVCCLYSSCLEPSWRDLILQIFHHWLTSYLFLLTIFLWYAITIEFLIGMLIMDPSWKCNWDF